MRTLSRSRVYAMRAAMRANRWPLPGLGPVQIVHPSPSTATLYAMEDVRRLAASHGRTDDSRDASAAVAMLAATHGREY